MIASWLNMAIGQVRLMANPPIPHTFPDGQAPGRRRRAVTSLVAQIPNLLISPKIVASRDDSWVGTHSTASHLLSRIPGTQWNASLPFWLRRCHAAPYRRLPVGRPFERCEGCGLEIRDTAANHPPAWRGHEEYNFQVVEIK
ncbi:MAG: hypothetical protein AAB466_05930, partial [Verrucomicrobiota bacterium]